MGNVVARRAARDHSLKHQLVANCHYVDDANHRACQCWVSYAFTMRASFLAMSMLVYEHALCALLCEACVLAI